MSNRFHLKCHWAAAFTAIFIVLCAPGARGQQETPSKTGAAATRFKDESTWNGASSSWVFSFAESKLLAFWNSLPFCGSDCPEIVVSKPAYESL